MKQLGLALHNYHDEYDSFPPTYTVNENGKPLHSWRVLILPFFGEMEENDLYKQIRLDEPWDSPHNAKLAEQIPDFYRCPSFAKYHRHHDLETSHNRLFTNYVAVISPGGIFQGSQATKIADITDGTTNTLLLMEARQHSVHWMQPEDVSPDEILYDLQASTDDDHANHIGGLHILIADSSVRFISANLDVETFRGLLTRNGGEELGEF